MASPLGAPPRFVRWCHERGASHSFTFGGTTEIPNVSKPGHSCIACVVAMPQCDSVAREDQTL